MKHLFLIILIAAVILAAAIPARVEAKPPCRHGHNPHCTTPTAPAPPTPIVRPHCLSLECQGTPVPHPTSWTVVPRATEYSR